MGCRLMLCPCKGGRCWQCEGWRVRRRLALHPHTLQTHTHTACLQTIKEIWGLFSNSAIFVLSAPPWNRLLHKWIVSTCICCVYGWPYCIIFSGLITINTFYCHLKNISENSRVWRKDLSESSYSSEICGISGKKINVLLIETVSFEMSLC